MEFVEEGKGFKQGTLVKFAKPSPVLIGVQY